MYTGKYFVIFLPEFTSQPGWVHRNCAICAATAIWPLSSRWLRHNRGVLPSSSLWSRWTPASTSWDTRLRLTEVTWEVRYTCSGPWPEPVVTSQPYCEHKWDTWVELGLSHVARYLRRGQVRLVTSLSSLVGSSWCSLFSPRQCSRRVLTGPSRQKFKWKTIWQI